MTRVMTAAQFEQCLEEAYNQGRRAELLRWIALAEVVMGVVPDPRALHVSARGFDINEPVASVKTRAQWLAAISLAGMMLAKVRDIAPLVGAELDRLRELEGSRHEPQVG